MKNGVNTKVQEKSTLPKPNNIVVVPISMGIGFFRWWCNFLKSFISLTPRELDVTASFLKQRWELSKSIDDPSILDEMVMSESTKKKVIEECEITKQHFYVVMSNLRKNKVIINDKINSRLVPNIRKNDNGCFQLLILLKDDIKKET